MDSLLTQNKTLLKHLQQGLTFNTRQNLTKFLQQGLTFNARQDVTEIPTLWTHF